MYHAIMLSDMLDIVNISNDYDSNNKNKLLDIARKKIPLMMQFLIDMHHTDSNISHFNDSANGVAPTLKKLLSYYEKLGFELNKDTQSLKDYDKSGFFVLTQDETKVIFDCCEIGASYIPGHGHADTLSFELSMKEKCIFVNSGISTYEDNKIRAFQRSTKAHNTVQINSINSSEVWSSFRVGKRASILYRSSDCFKEKIFCMAAHDGYKKQGILHERSLSLCKNNLELVDKIDGKFKDAKARFYLHPDVILVDKKGTLDICVDDLKMQINLIGYEYKVLDSYYYPEFGISLPNKCLEVKYSNNLNLIKMHW